jgi:hypothetical protein
MVTKLYELVKVENTPILVSSVVRNCCLPSADLLERARPLECHEQTVIALNHVAPDDNLLVGVFKLVSTIIASVVVSTHLSSNRHVVLLSRSIITNILIDIKI